jgi:hypothetical protein
VILWRGNGATSPNEVVEPIVFGAWIFPPADSCNFAADLLPCKPCAPVLCQSPRAPVTLTPNLCQHGKTPRFRVYHRTGGIREEKSGDRALCAIRPKIRWKICLTNLLTID